MTRGRGLVAARLLAAVVALAGVVLLVLGATRGGAAGSDTTSAGTTRLDGVAAVTTAPGVLAGGATTVRLRASATTADTPVFVGVARADDVTAWVGDLARVDVLGAGEEGALDIARTDGATTAPDPARADIWVAASAGRGAAELDWTPAPGQWRAVVVGGTAAGTLERVDVGLTRPTGGSSAPALVATGLVLLVAGGAALLVLRRRAATAGSGDDEFYDDYDDHDDGDDGYDDDRHGTDDRSDDGTGSGGPPSPGGRTVPAGGAGPDPDTTAIPRVHGRRRAGTPPWTRVALPVGLVVALGVTGCSGGSPAAGTPASATSGGASGASVTAGDTPAYPALLVPQAEAVLDKVDAALVAARRSGSADEAGGRVLGPFAERLAAEAKVAKGSGGAASPSSSPSSEPSASGGASPSASSTAGLARDRLVLTRAAAWPRFFLVAGAAPGLPTPVVRVLLSKTARDPYGVWAQPVLLPGATLPEVAAAGEGAAVLAPDATGLVATPHQAAAGYADVLGRSTASTSAALFAPDEFRRQVSSRLAADRKGVAAVGTVTSTHAVDPDGVLAFRTAAGGAVVVAALRQTYTVTLTSGAGTVRVDDDLAALGGRRTYAKSLRRTSIEVVVLDVPPAGGGLVRVVAASKDDVAVTGS